MPRIRIPILSIAALVGLALIGDGIAGSTGAGVALVGSTAGVFLIAFIAVGQDTVRPRRKTLRHRSYLALDRWRRRRAVRARDRDARKHAELAYLARRRSRR